MWDLLCLASDKLCRLGTRTLSFFCKGKLMQVSNSLVMLFRWCLLHIEYVVQSARKIKLRPN